MPAKKITRTDRIARRLKSAQVEKGLTQERVAKKMGVGTSTVSYWYRDINRLGVLRFEQLCAVLGISPQEIHDIK